MNVVRQKLQRSLQLFQRAVLVIRKHPRLLVFPLVTGLLTTGIALFFLAPVALVLLAPHWAPGAKIQALADHIALIRINTGFNFQVRPLGTLILAELYLLNLFVATMASVAFSSEIFEALNDRPVSISHGVAVACKAWKAVLLWSLMAGSVGLFIRWLEEKFSLFGRLVVGLIGSAWSVAAIFAIPILVREPTLTNPMAILSGSVSTIKKTWGEMVVGYLGMQGAGAVVIWGSLVCWSTAVLLALLTGTWWVLLPAGALWLLALVVYSYLTSVANRVYLCALYLYATEGTVASPYDSSMMAIGLKLKE